ncbi:MAG: RNB domain-containing ribonuclease, partial [Saccharopolyspora rectivirgula]
MAAAESPPGGTGVAAAEQTTLDFSGVRAELGLPTGYPDAALAEVKQRLGRPLTGNYWDAAGLPLVTIDPPG